MDLGFSSLCLVQNPNLNDEVDLNFQVDLDKKQIDG